MIGTIGLHEDIRRGDPQGKMMGYVLAKPYWGRGFMPEVAKKVLAYGFHDLDLEIITIYHFATNSQSKRVIEKCGFVYEGILRRGFSLFNGTVEDSVCYSILKKEYEPIKKHDA